MKKLITIIALLIIAQVSVSAKCFDAVFNRFKSVENAEYVKIPGFLMKALGGNDLKLYGKVDDLPLTMEFSGLKVIELDGCSPKEQQKFTDAVMNAGKKCELMLDASDDDDDVCIWLEPKNAKTFDKMIIFSKNDHALIELSGKFSFK